MPCLQIHAIYHILVLPENAADAAVVSGLQVIPIHNLREATGLLEGLNLRKCGTDPAWFWGGFAVSSGSVSPQRAGPVPGRARAAFATGVNI
jgi:hypothetical protein